MRNLNEDTNSNWYYEDKTLSGHLYNGFMLDPVNGYPEYDKEMLRQTVLEQEAIFRKQVYELHRLYRIQKDLMDELKVSDLFSSQMPSKITEQAWQMPRLPTGNTGYNGEFVAGINETRLPLNFMRERHLQSSPIPSRNGSFLKDSQKNFDLQLPADVYIDNEDSERQEKKIVDSSSFKANDPLNTLGGVETGDDVKLSLGFGEDYSCRKRRWKSDSLPTNDLSIHGLNDLIEPTKDIYFEGKSGLSTTKFLHVATYHERMQAYKLPNNRSHPQEDILIDIHRDGGTCTNFFSADKDETRQEWPLIHSEVGQSSRDTRPFNPSLCYEKLPMLVKPIQLQHTRSHEIVLPDQNKTQTLFKDKTSDAIEIYGRGSHFVNSIYSRPALPHSDYPSIASSPISAWRKPTKSISHIPIAVQALPCFNGSTAMNVQSKSSCFDSQNLGFQSNPNFSEHFRRPPVTVSIPNLGNHSDKSAHSNSDGRGHHNCFETVQFPDVKPTVDARLNQALPNGIQDGLTAQQDFFQLKRSYNTVSPEIKMKQEKGKGPSLPALQDFPSSLLVEEDRMRRNEASDSLNAKRIFGFPILDLARQNFSCSPRDNLHHTKGLRNHIDLNSSDNSHEDEEEFPSSLSLLSLGGKASPEIDLEVPAAAQGTESVISQIEIVGTNHSATPIRLPLSNTDGQRETECSDETPVRVAAENLVVMSSDVLSRPLTAPSCFSLQWFAEIVSSNAESAKPQDVDELDYFESATLELKEMKVDEYRRRPWVPENQKDGGMGTASMLLTRPRRGQGRRRRQRRDFQKDILPGLASLSRNEVTKDLQALGGLVRARRKSSGNGFSCQAKGRRRPRSLAVSVAEIRVDPKPTQPARAESELDGRGIVGWGRTTRRCRGQRVPSAQPVLEVLE